MLDNLDIEMTKYPTDADWAEVYHRAMLTVGKDKTIVPSMNFRQKILAARHSPIRYLRFSFELTNIPYWVACELRTHVHDMPYVADFGVYIKTSRNDRQADFDRNAARQDTPVNMIMDINGEQLMILANKRLCNKATAEAREAVTRMCHLAEEKCPEYTGLLVPNCIYHGGICHEMMPCGKCGNDSNEGRESQ